MEPCIKSFDQGNSNKKVCAGSIRKQIGRPQFPLSIIEHCLGVHLQITAKSSRQQSSCLCSQLCSTSRFWTQCLEMHTRGLKTSALKLHLPSSPTLLSRGTWVQWLQLLAKLYWLPSLKEQWLSIRKPFRPSVPYPVPQVQTKFYCLRVPCFPPVLVEHESKAIVSILASLGFSTIVCSFLGEFYLVPLCLRRGIQIQMLAWLGGNIKSCKDTKIQGANRNSTLHVQHTLPPQHDPSWRWNFSRQLDIGMKS